jgi:hypothetical protein
MKIITPLLLPFLLAAFPARAEEAALGRLFLTPQQRQALDQQRYRAPGDNREHHLTVNGEVRRSGGGSTRWINGQAGWNSNAPQPKVPVGDSYDPATGNRQPLLDGGRIIVNPRQP